jgi:hypothetical protein
MNVARQSATEEQADSAVGRGDRGDKKDHFGVSRRVSQDEEDG